MTYGTKQGVIETYLDEISERYPWAQGGGPVADRGLELARIAATNALDGNLKLQGAGWEAALSRNGFPTRMTGRQLAEIPA